MSLQSGTHLGPYEILSPLGAGGMGEVYKARDTRLDRFVAVKVLPEHLATNAEALARFEREARAVAALNHPNITGIFDLGRAEDTAYAVMELLEGESLRARLDHGPVPPRKATELAIQMAQGLAAAHEKGVVHRDLKPDNLWITQDGRLKILDFGLAKQMAAMDQGPDSLLATAAISQGRHTEKGMILGTLGYMSPEQVRGEAVDARADIFSFGAVLFEMLTGRRAFGRATGADTLAAILKEDPPEWDEGSKPLPAGLRRVLEHCLEKRPALRFQSAQDLTFALQNSDTSSAFPTLAAAPGARWLRWTLAAAVVSLGLGLWFLRPKDDERRLRKFPLPIVDLKTGVTTSPLLSPDGRHVAYVAGRALWVRDLDRMEPRKIFDGERPICLAWSPDSSQLAFIAQRKVFRIPAAGGSPNLVGGVTFPIGGQTPGTAWLEDGRIVFSPAASGSGIYAAPAQGGEFTILVPRIPGQDSDFHKPSVLPDGRSLLFVVDSDKAGANSLAVWADGKRKEIFRTPGEAREFLDAPVYSPSGHILFQRTIQSPGIWALPFSLAKLEATGSPFMVVPEGHWPSVSRDGSLLYCGSDDSLNQLVVVDRSRRIQAVSSPELASLTPAFSPDGTRIAWCNPNLMVLDLRRKASMRLTFDTHLNSSPSWTPAGDRIFYSTRAGGAGRQIWSTLADGSGKPAPARTLDDQEEEFGFDPFLSGDGRWLLFTRVQPERGMDIFSMDLKEGNRVAEVLSAPGQQTHPKLSPDGRLLLYQGDETGRDEIHIRSFPGATGHWQVSPRGGTHPRWSAKGDRVYFIEGNALMEVEVSQKPTLAFGAPRKILDLEEKPALSRAYDVSPDGRTFVFSREVQTEGDLPKLLTLVENWDLEFAARQPK